MLHSLHQHSFDLLLLEWAVRGLGALEVISWVEQHLDPAPPTIVVTERSDDADIVTALTSGADDYLVKPFQDDMLKARVDTLIRRVYGRLENQCVEHFGKYAFDIQSRSVSIAGAQIALSAKEFELALLMFRNLHRPLSRGYILETVWWDKSNFISRTLDSHISQIRSRLELRPENGFRLSSVYGFGYRLERISSAVNLLAANDGSTAQANQA